MGLTVNRDQTNDYSYRKLYVAAIVYGLGLLMIPNIL